MPRYDADSVDSYVAERSILAKTGFEERIEIPPKLQPYYIRKVFKVQTILAVFHHFRQ